MISSAKKLQEYGNRDWLAEIDEYSTASNVLSPEDAYIRKETIREIRKMISNTIGEKGLMVMEAHYCHHISLKDIAARMGISTAHSRCRCIGGEESSPKGGGRSDER